jgi:uncharacterized protein
MIYNRIGKTGLMASILGFGCMRLPMLEVKNPPKDFFERQKAVDEDAALEMIDSAIEQGINYFDTAYMYHGGNSETILGKGIRGKRDKLIITSKSPMPMINSHDDFDRILDEQLEKLGTDYLDFYLLHGLNMDSWNKAKELHALDFLDRCLKDGRVRHAGFSFHDSTSVFKEIIDSYDWEVCQIQYNYFDENYQAGREGLMYAASKGMGIIIMEPLRGGRLTQGIPASVAKIWESAKIKRSPAEWALMWVINHSEVSVVLSGMSSMDQLKDNLRIAESAGPGTLTPEEISIAGMAADEYRKLLKIDCTGCGYCMPCPEGVNIPLIFSVYNDYYLFNDEEFCSVMYNTMIPPDQNASNCIECGECENKCPQHIAVIDNLKAAHKTLFIENNV